MAPRSPSSQALLELARRAAGSTAAYTDQLAPVVDAMLAHVQSREQAFALVNAFLRIGVSLATSFANSPLDIGAHTHKQIAAVAASEWDISLELLREVESDPNAPEWIRTIVRKRTEVLKQSSKGTQAIEQKTQDAAPDEKKDAAEELHAAINLINARGGGQC